MNEKTRMLSHEEEKIICLEEEAMNQGEYMSSALNQYAAAHGEGHPNAEWILSPCDTWERNPYYVGKSGPHPEEMDAIFESMEDNDWYCFDCNRVVEDNGRCSSCNKTEHYNEEKRDARS